MKKVIAKILVCLTSFLVTLIIAGRLQSRGNTDMTKELGPATLPIVYMDMDGVKLSVLHGYVESRDTRFLRDNITPLGEDRRVNVCVEKYGLKVDTIRFEVRSMDGSRLIEKNDVTNYQEVDDEISFSLPVKDLIEDNTEYELVIILVMEDGSEVYYYTRVIYASEYHSAEKLMFVANFQEKTLDKERVNDLSRYMETSAKGDNTSLAHVNIHSSMEQLSYGELPVKQYTDAEFSFCELSEQTASIRCKFLVSVKNNRDIQYYQVTECYRVRYTVDRIYLLDYEREMSEIIDPSGNGLLVDGELNLGIQAGDCLLGESEGGDVFTFVNAGRLYAYNLRDGRLEELFSFFQNRDRDERTLYDQHAIQVLSVDEAGNVCFCVYGYMNKGPHEGCVGIAVYYYNSLTNATEEQVFIPYAKSAQILQSEMERLSYLSGSNIFYFILDDNIIGTDLATGQVEILAESVPQEGLRISQDQSNLVWQNGRDVDHSHYLTRMNLGTRVQSEIRGEVTQYVKPIGFMGNDLIYGVANYSDVYTDRTGITTFGMSFIRIQDENGTLLKEYSAEGMYVTEARIVENQLIMERSVKAKDGESYVYKNDDQILSSIPVTYYVNQEKKTSDGNYELVSRIVLKEKSANSYKLLTPRFVLFEGDRQIDLGYETQMSRYYVYKYGKVIGLFHQPEQAVTLANAEAATVINDAGAYVWLKGNRPGRNQIMAIKAHQESAERGSVAVCLDTLLEYEGSIRNSQFLLDEGQTVISIMQEGLEGKDVLDLSGCALDCVLYYVSRDIPVLALTGDKAYLIIGYNENQIVLMDPGADGLYKKNTVDMSDYFIKEGAVFLTYLK